MAHQVTVGPDSNGRTAVAVGGGTHGIRSIGGGTLRLEQVALGLLHHEVVHQRQGHHSFHHGDGPREHARVVPSLPPEFHFLAVAGYSFLHVSMNEGETTDPNKTYCETLLPSPIKVLSAIPSSRNKFVHGIIISFTYLYLSNRRSWFECYMDHDVLTITDTALNTTRSIRLGTGGTGFRVNVEFIVVILTRQ